MRKLFCLQFQACILSNIQGCKESCTSKNSFSNNTHLSKMLPIRRTKYIEFNFIQTFTFDGVYGPDSTTEQIYNDNGFGLVEVSIWDQRRFSTKNINILGSFSHAEIEFVLMFIKITINIFLQLQNIGYSPVLCSWSQILI